MTKSKLKEDNKPVESTKTEQKPKPMIDFMPGWAKEEKCFKEAIVRDVVTKKIVENGWPRQPNTAQYAYESWLSRVVNSDTGEFFQERDNEGIPIKGTGGRYVVTVICRIRDQTGKKEYLTTKGALIGFDEAGSKVERHISQPEVWTRTNFRNEKTYNPKTGASTTQTIGPSGSEQVYDLSFSEQGVLGLFEKVEDENVMLVLKDNKVQEAKEVKWGSVKDSLDLFCRKSFDYLWKAEYIPLPVRQELRQEAVSKGLIKGVASDYQMQSSGPTSAGVE